jgi:hypothetical protein
LNVSTVIPIIAGKIQELVEAGEHLERASHLHIRPRLRLFLEKRYIELVARQPQIEEIETALVRAKAPKTLSASSNADVRTRSSSPPV